MNIEITLRKRYTHNKMVNKYIGLEIKHYQLVVIVLWVKWFLIGLIDTMIQQGFKLDQN